jgi:hypothetical protein
MYRRLPGRGTRRRGGLLLVPVRSTLWLGPDHLLCVDSLGGYREDYRRFDYRDIQVVELERTLRWLGWAAVLGGAAGAAAALGGLAPEPVWRGFWWILGGVFGVIFLGNMLLGPTCRCRLRTAVHTEELPSLGRWWSARRSLVWLCQQIEQVQGTLSPEALRAQLDETSAEPSPPVVAAHPVVRPGYPAPTRAPRGPFRPVWHRWLFTLVLVDAFRAALDLAVDGLWIACLQVLLMVGVGGFALAAVIHLQRAAVPVALRRPTWAGLAYVLVSVGLGYVTSLVLSFQHADAGMAPDQVRLFLLYAQASPFDMPVILVSLVVSLVMGLVVGLDGWLTLRRLRAPTKVMAANGSSSPPAPSVSA